MFDYKIIIDISLPLDEKTIVYPGNPALNREKMISLSGAQLTKLTLGTHSGTHIDAPGHVFASGKYINELPMENFIGPCRVLDARECQKAVTKEYLETFHIVAGERILLKTKNSDRGYKEFCTDYIYLESEAAQYLATQNVKLVGIDYLSIKEKGSSDNTSHTALLGKDIPILEGINLANVEAGEYFLMAVPLALQGVDGSPVRALLLR